MIYINVFVTLFKIDCCTVVMGMYQPVLCTFLFHFDPSACVRKKSMQKVGGTITDPGERDMYKRVLSNKVLFTTNNTHGVL